MKTTLSAGLLLSIVALSGCSHHNSLKAMPREDVGRLLAQASYTAELALHVPHAQGRVYAQCLFQDKTVGVNCGVLYQKMLAYAHTQPQFQHITLSDITDVNHFYRVKEDYEAAVFNIIPDMPS